MRANGDQPVTRIIQLSDTHLSHIRGFFVDNFLSLVDRLTADPPDLTVITGDLSLDGADSEDDLAFTRHLFDRLPGEVLWLPGNHDVGEEPGASHTDQPVTPHRLARYQRVFGADHWLRDLPGWRLIGLNVHLFETGLPEERAQWDCLTGALDGAGSRRIGLFLHKPLFIAEPEETPDAGLSIVGRARDRLLELMAGHKVDFVTSGHLHQGCLRRIDGLAHVWAPSTAFEGSKPRCPEAETRLGLVRLNLPEEGPAVIDIEFCNGLTPHCYDAIKDYGRYTFLKDVPPAPSRIDWPA